MKSKQATSNDNTCNPKTGPIQRLAILHLTLDHICLGKPLDESASDKEISEHILYFYSENTTDSVDAPDSSGRSNSSSEAIQFAGLCSALYSLPSSIEPTVSHTDRTREVLLDHCSLTFVTLEETHLDLVAVAQIARHSVSSRGGTPFAVAEAIRKSHDLFCLLRYGGIHRRLQQDVSAGTTKTKSTCLYPGMEGLYSLRRRVGRKQQSLRRKGTDSLTKDEVLLLDAQTDELYGTLPIGRLSSDLSMHYDEFLSETSNLASQYLGVYRGIVEALPAPPPLSPDARSYNILTMESRPLVANMLTLRIQGFLDSHYDTIRPRIVGVSLFVEGNLAWSQTATRHTDGPVSNQTAAMIFRYIQKFRIKMEKHVACTKETESSTHFLGPPSLSLLSATDERNAFDGPRDGEMVWVPQVCIRGASKTKPENGRWKEMRVFLLYHKKVSFLFYMETGGDIPSTIQNRNTIYRDIFRRLSSEVPEMLSTKEDGNSENFFSVREWNEPGQVVIFVDRSQDLLILYRPILKENRNEDAPLRKLSLKDKLIKLTGKDKTRPKSPTRLQRDKSSYSSPDARHFLSSRLSLDSILAFDDAMKDVAEHRLSSSMEGEGSLFELCTAIKQGWMYTLCLGCQELYALFDPHFFATLADAQSGAARIRAELLKDIFDRE
jgi:hypothetical protein